MGSLERLIGRAGKTKNGKTRTRKENKCKHFSQGLFQLDSFKMGANKDASTVSSALHNP